MTPTSRNTPRWLAARRAVLAAARRMGKRGLVTGMAGNVSMRLPSARGRALIAVTPSQRPYDRLRPEDIVVVDSAGAVVDGSLAPSSELPLHLAVYRARSDVGAVMHTHSVHASALAVAGLALPPVLDELVVFVGGAVEVAEYGMSGTREMAERAVRALGDRNAALLRNHGLVGVGGTPGEALGVCELVERAARVYIMASLLGGPPCGLPPDVVRKEGKLFRARQAKRRQP